MPASKGEIFKTKYLSLMEKRSLTRFLNFCLAEEISADILKTNFKDFLNDQKLPPKLQEFLLYSVVFQTSSSSRLFLNFIYLLLSILFLFLNNLINFFIY